MATLDEVKLDALNTAGFTSGSLNERELQWLANQTGESGLTIDEHWNLLLHTNGYTAGPLNERQMLLFDDLSFTGSWNERALAFWLAGGAFPP